MPFPSPETVESSIASVFSVSCWLDIIRRQPTGLVLLILAAGIIFLLVGRRAVQLAVILNAAMIGGYLGWQLGIVLEYPKLAAAGAAVVFAILAWPMFKVALALCVGAVGAATVVLVLTALSPDSDYLPIATGVGFICFALLGRFLTNPAIVVFTSLQGSAGIIFASLALLERGPDLATRAFRLVCPYDRWIIVAVFVLALLGATFQSSKKAPAEKSTPKAATPAKR